MYEYFVSAYLLNFDHLFSWLLSFTQNQPKCQDLTDRPAKLKGMSPPHRMFCFTTICKTVSPTQSRIKPFPLLIWSSSPRTACCSGRDRRNSGGIISDSMLCDIHLIDLTNTCLRNAF